MKRFHLMLFAVSAIVAIASVAIPSVAQEKLSPTTAADAPARILFTHPGTNLGFPSRMDEYRCQSVQFFSEDRDVGVQYLWPDRSELSIFVYPAPENTFGPTFKLNPKGELMLDPQPGHVFVLNEPSESFTQHFAQCKENVVKAKRLKHLRDGRMQAKPENDGPLGYMAQFGDAEKRVYSELILYAVKGHFILIRKTCSADDLEACLASPALHILDWPHGAGGRPKDGKVQRDPQP